MTELEEFCTVLEGADGQPSASFASLAALADRLIGVKLFTLTALDGPSDKVSRIYSSMPDAYPVKGTKDIEDDPWTRHVLRDHRTFVANSIDEIAEVFPDHALIQSLGCESCLNLPIVVGGTVLGTVNCLNDSGHYNAERVARSSELKLPGATAFLAAKHFQTGASQ